MENLNQQGLEWLKKQDVTLYYDMINTLESGIGQVELLNENGILINISGIWEFACEGKDCSQEFVSFLKKQNLKDYSLCVRGNCNIEKIKQTLNLNNYQTDCWLFTRFSKEKFKVITDAEIKYLTKDYAPLIAQTYTFSSDMEDSLKFAEDRIRAGVLGAFKNGECIGYIGTHHEGTMGMLEIKPEYRRNGYGQALEESLANIFIDKGFYPFCHVLISNAKSCALQEKMGFTSSNPNKIIWLG